MCKSRLARFVSQPEGKTTKQESAQQLSTRPSVSVWEYMNPTLSSNYSPTILSPFITTTTGLLNPISVPFPPMHWWKQTCSVSFSGQDLTRCGTGEKSSGEQLLSKVSTCCDTLNNAWVRTISRFWKDGWQKKNKKRKRRIKIIISLHRLTKVRRDAWSLIGKYKVRLPKYAWMLGHWPWR